MRLMLELEALWHLWGARRRVARSSAREIVSSLDATSPGRRRASAAAVHRAYRRALGRLRGDACLVRAYGLARMLRHHGHDADLVIGVRFRGHLERGHAWVEIDGAPFGEPEGKTEDYEEFLRTPAREGERLP